MTQHDTQPWVRLFPGQKGEPSTFLLLLPGDACFSLSFTPSCIFEIWAPCAPKEAKESPGGLCHQEAMWHRILWDGRAADEDDEHCKVDEEKVSDKVCQFPCVKVKWPSHACYQICPYACWLAPSFFFVLPLQSCANGGKENLGVWVDHWSSGGGIGCGVCCVGWLHLLLFLVLFFAQMTLRMLVHASCHMMLTPMVSLLAHLFALLVSGLGGHLLPCFDLLLLGLVSSLLPVLRHPIATFSFSLALAFALDNIS